MGVQGFQDYIEKHCPSAVVPVELQKLARGSLVGGGRQRPPHTPLRLLVDADNCLHRLYGGFYTDWVSGGQWNHMLGYLAALAKACFGGNIELFVFFNGALEKARLHEWVKRQGNERQTAQQIVSHVQNKGTPPPKVWFLPPVCMAHCIRLALIRFHVKVAQSIEDHHQEVIGFCRENGFHGLVAYDSDYALCNIPYYFSAHALKLSRNGKSLTTSQYLMHEVAKQLDLNPNRFPIFAALLGNHILPDEDLASFHWSLLGPEHPLASLKVRAHQLVLPPCDVVIKAVADYVRNIQDPSDLDAVAKDVFQHSQSRTDDKVIRFKRAIGYYSATSKPMAFHPAHYLGCLPACQGVSSGVTPEMETQPGRKDAAPAKLLRLTGQGHLQESRVAHVGPRGCRGRTACPEQRVMTARPNPFGMPGIVPPYVPPQMLNIPQTPLQAKPVAPQVPSPGAAGQGPHPYSLAEPALTLETSGKSLTEHSTYSNIPHEGKHTPLYERSSPIHPAPGGSPNHVDSAYFPGSSTSSSSDNDEGSGAAANHISGNKIGWEKTGSHSEPQTRGDPGDQTKTEGSSTASSGSQLAEGKGSQLGTVQPIPCLLSMPTRNHMDITTPPLPPVAPEVLRVAEHRHKKGLMYPYIFHVLTKGEIKIAVSIEDEASKDLPPAALLYRPVRQYVYGVLFSLAESRKKTERLAFRKNRLPPEFPPVIIKEWAAYKGKSPQTPELVEALAFREWTCPNLKRLWLGKAVEDKNRRMRAFLACMRSDTPAMLNPASVPTHLTVLCCVLRYMVQWPGARILRRQELDAFLAQALSPKLYEPDQLQELKIITSVLTSQF
ncbi:constitutive coactivator of PPAR-gamma-like protein 1 isoform X6 [Mustela erminea]|uniref:constitutive coactivator of PPAR-gamma-like protein 1 isoform X6 n=1 Tax=Mustela erminea TaxID=36723 RepID=UPI0013869528|nr:constitutive coactivator of PPAR-gamma-like protein 1 isoform X6 [Mustela erminea]